ncbi:hypothetical protein WDW86_21715, partial [Bdellovibrionota bacterium FG-2]
FPVHEDPGNKFFTFVWAFEWTKNDLGARLSARHYELDLENQGGGWAIEFPWYFGSWLFGDPLKFGGMFFRPGFEQLFFKNQPYRNSVSWTLGGTYLGRFEGMRDGPLTRGSGMGIQVSVSLLQSIGGGPGTSIAVLFGIPSIWLR